MPIPKSGVELSEAINSTFEKLLVEFAAIPIDKVYLKTMPGHAKDTIMSPHNLAAYLVGWAELVLLWWKQKEAGNEIDFPATGFKWNELGLLAQKFYSDYESIPYQKLLQRLELRKNELIKLINELSEEELFTSESPSPKSV